MQSIEPEAVLLDTSVLINFLAVDKVPLLAKLSDYQFLVTDHVIDEITEHYPEQLQRLKVALKAQMLIRTRIDSIPELELFAELDTIGFLGSGECAAIAAASTRRLGLAIDDKAARRVARGEWASIPLFNTQSLVVLLIKSGELSISEADTIKSTWEVRHRFRLKITSFGELL